MADKNITIKGLINFDTSQAQKSLNEISKSLSKVEKTSFGKMNDEFKKTTNILKNLDKDASRFFDKLSKREANDQLKSLNNSLKEQTKLLKDAVSEQEALAAAIAKTTDAKQKEILIQKRDQHAANTRSLMGDINENVDQRRKLQKVVDDRNTESVLKTAGIIRMVGAIVKEAVTHVSGADYRRISYEAQGQNAPNKLANMMFSKNLDYGVLAATGSLNRAFNSTEKMQKGGWIARAGDALKTVGEHSLAGAVGGTVLAPGIGTTGGALLGGASGVITAIGNNKDLLDPALRKSAITAEKSNLTSEELENLRSKYAFAIDLANERIGLAPAKLAGAQAITGYDKAGALSKRLSGAISTGWKYGYSIPETASLLQMNSGAGLIGSERSNLGPMALMERAGLSSPGETADMARRMGGIVNNQQNIMKMFEQAMTRGVQTGIEKSLVKDLVSVAENLAEGGTARIDNLDSIMRDLRTSLGSMSASQIGRQDILESQNALSQFRSMRGGANNAMGMAIQSLSVQEGLKNAGIDVGKLPSAALMAITSAKSIEEVTNNPSLMRELAAAAEGDKSKLTTGLNNIELYKNLGVAKQMEGISNADEISTTEGLKRYQAGLGKGASAEEKARSQGIRDKLILSYQVSKGVPYNEAEKFINQFGGQGLSLDQGRKIDNSVAGLQAYGDVKFTTAVEAQRETLRGKKEFSTMIDKAKSEQMTAESDWTKKGGQSLFDEGAPLVVSMGKLEAAIRENTEAMERRQGYRTPNSPEGYNTPDEKTVPETILDKVNEYLPNRPSFKPLTMPTSGQMKGP